MSYLLVTAPYTVNVSSFLPTKQQITSSLFENDTTLVFSRSEFNSASTYVPAQLAKKKTNFFYVMSMRSRN